MSSESEDIQAFEKLIYSYVGKKVCDRTPAKDDVNAAMIRHWVDCIGDNNPAYSDPEWAAQSSRGEVIAPPAMMYAWGQEGFPVVAQGRAPDAQTEMVDCFNEHGYIGVLGTNVKQEYFQEAKLGDTIYMEMVIDNISERKETGRGVGYFFETLGTFTNQDGEKIGTQRFRVLKFIPPQQ